MDNFDENELGNEIGQLLRLKKFEQPPPGYFENFLHEFHRRQRDELLRQPVWSVLWQRLSDSLFRFNIPSLTSYPVAVAAVLVCAAVLSLKVYQSPQSPSVAVIDATPVSSMPSVIDQMTTEQVPDNFTLRTSLRDESSSLATRSLGPDLSRQMTESAYTHRTAAPPRYVLDRLPVSYEPSFKF
ncbi:MAG: hypothetical protein ABI787_12105 [Spartobacteria bacterium]